MFIVSGMVRTREWKCFRMPSGNVSNTVNKNGEKKYTGHVPTLLKFLQTLPEAKQMGEFHSFPSLWKIRRDRQWKSFRILVERLQGCVR